MSRAVIDQAKGILMERHKLTADQAFQLLVRHLDACPTGSSGELADELVRTGVLPSQEQSEHTADTVAGLACLRPERGPR